MAIQIQIKAFVIKLSVLRKSSAVLTSIKDLGGVFFFIVNFKVLALKTVQKWVLNMHKQTVQYSAAYRRPLDGWADRCSAVETFLLCL